MEGGVIYASHVDAGCAYSVWLEDSQLGCEEDGRLMLVYRDWTTALMMCLLSVKEDPAIGFTPQARSLGPGSVDGSAAVSLALLEHDLLSPLVVVDGIHVS